MAGSMRVVAGDQGSKAMQRPRLHLALAVLGLALVGVFAATPAYAAPTSVTTRALDTGPSSELVSSLPIASGEPSTTSVYSLTVPAIENGETLRVTGNLELNSSHSYATSISARLVLVEGLSETNGTIISPWSTVTQVGGAARLTLPINGTYQASSKLGTRYLKLQVKASSPSAKAGDTIAVVSNAGRLALTRYAQTAAPTSLPTDELEPLLSQLSQQITSLPVDSTWRVVLSRKVGELSAQDVLEVVDQLQVENTSEVNGAPPVKLESKVTRTTSATASTGPWVVEPSLYRLTAEKKQMRIVNGGAIGPVTDPANKYVNLSVQAIPIQGSPAPLKVVAGSGALNLLRFKPKSGNPESSLLEGADEQSPPPWYDVPEVSAIPFAAEGKEPRVVNTQKIYDLRKGDVVRGRGLLTVDLTGKEAGPAEIALVLADTKAATTGETVAARSGDTVGSNDIQTLYKEGTYIAPKASGEVKYLNLVAYANRAPAKSNETMSVTKSSLSYSRSQATGPFSANFESATLDQFFFASAGTLTASSTQAREGAQSLQVDVDKNSHTEGDKEGVARALVIPDDARGAGGYDGEDSWYGFSVYFPTTFKAPPPEQPTESAGPWDIFAQWHHSSVGLDCYASGSPPVAFGARYYEAKNKHINPGETKIATPEDGDYLEVQFLGGELKETEKGVCGATVVPRKNYVLAPLQRNQWYDFVLHTRWTPEEGGPGNSVSEVWMNGKQVLGNQTNPVTWPSLFWHGSLAVHNTEIASSYGIYRGPSEEEQRLFIDSIRSGDSYAAVSP